MSNPRYWCRPLNPDKDYMKRYVAACREYVLSELAKHHPEYSYRVMLSNVFHYNLNQLDLTNPCLRLEMREVNNAMTACLAIIKDPAW